MLAIHIPNSCLDIYTEIFQQKLNFINININKKILHKLLDKYTEQPSILNYHTTDKLQHSIYLNFLSSQPKEQEILDYISFYFDEEVKTLNEQTDSPLL